MKWLLGPGAHHLLAPLHHHDLLAARVDTPEQAWAYQQELNGAERLWLIGHQDSLQNYCLPPWQGLYHLVALVDHPPTPQLRSEAIAFVGSSMRAGALAEFCHALQWPATRTEADTQVSSMRGQVSWQGQPGVPPSLMAHNQGHPVPVSDQPCQRWPSAQYWNLQASPAGLPLLMDDQWMANRCTLDALANLRESRAQTL